MIKTLKLISEHLDKSKIFAGVLIIILNIGSRIIPISLNKTTENFLKSVVPRDLIIFAIAWMGTRDVFIALLLTVAFICIFDYLLNFESKLCCLPLKYKCVETEAEISDEELNKAISVLEKSKKKKLIENQHETYSRLFS
uniref:Uncharacterized protein n=1 Tax=viral metagenome TaxID=1070528 RepID=A0A6C0HS58_9ZZZZ